MKRHSNNSSSSSRSALLTNRPRIPVDEMDDRQRRAMFAHLRGGGHGGASKMGTAPETWSSSGSNHLSPDMVKEELARDAQGIQPADADFLVAGVPGLKGLLSGLGPVGRALASWKTPLLSALASVGIGDYRDMNPTMDPRTDKALAIGQQLAGYLAAISGLAAGKENAADALERIPLGGTSAKEFLASKTSQFGQWLTDLGKAAASVLPDAVKNPLAALYKAYTTAADFTGASISDVMSATGAPAKFNAARKLEQAAQESLQQAADIERAASGKGEPLLTQAYDDLMASHKASLAGDPAARDAYLQAAGDFWDTKRGVAGSERSADSLRKYADALNEQAKELRTDAATSTIKATLAGGGFVAKEGHEESQIRKTQKAMEDAFAQGESFTVPAEQPRTTLGTALAAAVGTLGNPIEKQTRYGQDSYTAQVAYYRAQYDMIGKAEQSGELSRSEAEAARSKLAQSKPMNMAGKGVWTFAPASAAFLSWQAGNIADTLSRTTIDRRTPGSYIDGDTINFDQHHGANSVRLLDINAPEVAHESMHDPNHPERTTGEYLGKEAAVYAAKLVADGQYVRLKSDSHPKAAGTDVHGRTLATVETLPKPFDQLLRVPVLGKLIPAQEFQQQMIKAGLADIHYRELSGATDVGTEHDKARVVAQAKETGIWSPEARAQLPWVGTEKTVAERTGRTAAPISQTGNLLGAGLMVTGQSGLFKQMGAPGNIAAQAWNAVLAGLGAREYNARARQRPSDLVFKPPKAVTTEYEKSTQELLMRRRHRK